MKWMIASDIHGSAVYCGQMLEAYRREKRTDSFFRDLYIIGAMICRKATPERSDTDVE